MPQNLKSDWYKNVNPNLDRLAQLLGMAGPKPSHGYTIAEKAPEVVTAPGVYFPAEKGEVIPLQSRQRGGEVEGIFPNFSIDQQLQGATGGVPSIKEQMRGGLLNQMIAETFGSKVKGVKYPSPSSPSPPSPPESPPPQEEPVIPWWDSEAKRNRRPGWEPLSSSLFSREKGGTVTPSSSKDDKTRGLDILESIIEKINPSGMEAKAMMGLNFPPESMKTELEKYKILSKAMDILKPPKPPGQEKSSSGGGSSSEAKTSSPKSSSPNTEVNLPAPPTLPTVPTPMEGIPTPQSIQPEIRTDSPEINPMNENIINLTPDDKGTWSAPMFSRQGGGSVTPSLTTLSPEDELLFRSWYGNQAKTTGINLNPDDPNHFYDYRGAYKAGIQGPNAEGHWPSQFKLEDHPNLIVNGIDTRTGIPVQSRQVGGSITPSFEEFKKKYPADWSEEALKSLAMAAGIPTNVTPVSPSETIKETTLPPPRNVPPGSLYALEGGRPREIGTTGEFNKLLEEAETRTPTPKDWTTEVIRGTPYSPAGFTKQGVEIPGGTHSVIDWGKGTGELPTTEYQQRWGIGEYDPKVLAAKEAAKAHISPVGRLMQERDALVPGDPKRASYDAAIKKATEAEKALPSAGNAVDLAIKREFGTEALMNPEKSKEVDKWLNTLKGRKSVQQARDDLTPPAVTYLQASEGFTPAITRGAGVGTVGKPTGVLPPMSEDLKKDYTAVSQASDLTNQLKASWDSLGVSGGTLGRTHGVKLYGEAKAGINSNAKTYLDSRDAFLGNLSRSIAAERGVLTNQDIERISKAIPKIGINPLSTDNKEEAEKKWKMVTTIIQNAEKRLKERAEMRKGKLPDVGGSPQKTIIKKFISPSTGKTKYIYSDGTEEIK